ncbi:type VI secretion system membrane subunit TssM [Paraburkholderia sp. NMBU_R16]|uniref:type VI secretion system membrane subunit TssM n=1 Tax=Paraburkholderia sp. NMBU_R16 TaxID=2698676 RepID=UPI001563E569|nr:type VI secretion system membrane subunit TssM [Paraburkholderia sp. NMBU_R16]
MSWRTFAAALAVLLGLTLIWHQAPRVGYNGRTPFASPSARAWLVVALFACWAAFALGRWLVQCLRDVRIVRKAPRNETQDDGQAQADAAAADTSRRSRMALERSFRRALALIRGNGLPGAGRWRARKLPWYLVLGEHGTGKSAMLAASGLEFSHQRALADVDDDLTLHRWWLANEAILIEASPHGQAAKDGWQALLRKLRQTRRMRAIDGVVVTVDAGWLEDSAASAREGQAASIRERIDAMHRTFGIRFPIYVVVTRCDRLPGFAPFFEALDEGARAQVWGTTFELDSDAGSPLASFGSRFDALVRRLQARVVESLPSSGEPGLAAPIYGFPVRFAALGPSLRGFLQEAFGTSPYMDDAMLRGVYFTAAPPAACESRGERSGRRRGYFIERLLREVVFPEAGLAGRRLPSTRRQRIARRAAWAAIAVGTLVVAACLAISYERNLASIAALERADLRLTQLARAGVDSDAPASMLPVLDAARNLPLGYAQRDARVPLASRFGLSRSEQLGTAARARYQALLRATIEPFVARRLARALAAPGLDVGARYATLRVYLMLGDPAHFDATAVRTWAAGDACSLPLTDAQRADWLEHVDALFGNGSFKADVRLDAELVGSARAAIGTVPVAERVFDTIRPELEKAMRQPLAVDMMGGDDAGLVLIRKSGKPLTDGVPGAYTRRGYARYLTMRDAALQALDRNAWVMGRNVAPAGDPARRAMLAGDIDRYYFDRYIAAWDGILNDVSLRPLPKGSDGASIVKFLARPDSPLRMFLTTAAAQTTLAGDAAGSLDSGKGTGHATQSIWRTLLARAGTMFGSGRAKHAKSANGPAPGASGALVAQGRAADGRPADGRPADGRPVDRHFEALHRFVASGGDGKPSALDEVQRELAAAGAFLDAADAAHANGLPAPPGDALTALDQAALGVPQPMAGMLRGLSASGTAATLAGERLRLDALWRANVVPFGHAALDGRYPFVRTSQVDVTLDDFTRVFGPGGLIDTFFRNNIQQYVDMSTPHWSWKPSAKALGMSAKTLEMFREAAAIREAFFQDGSRTIQVRFALTPESMDPALTRFVLTLAGKTLDYQHDPRRAVSFDWPGAAAPQPARIDFAPAAADGRSAVDAQGQWRLFRLLDLGKLTRERADSFSLSFDFGGRKVSLDLSASSVVNPFALDALSKFQLVDTL